MDKVNETELEIDKDVSKEEFQNSIESKMEHMGNLIDEEVAKELVEYEQSGASQLLIKDIKLCKDEDVRLMCCRCFGRMGDDEIKSTMRIEGAEVDAKIRLQVYNPMESKKEEIESLTSTRRIFLKSKLKKWEQDTELVGKLTRTLHDEDYQENFNMYNAKTRYDTF